MKKIAWATDLHLEFVTSQATSYFREILPTALAWFPNLLLVTHVPPFKEACWHEGRISDDDFLPHFTSQAVGDVLLGLRCPY